MSTSALAAVVVVAAWWASTALVLRVVWLREATHRASLGVFGVLAALGFFGAIRLSGEESDLAAYLGFGCALAIWGWHELSFLLGAVTGPRKDPCPPEATGWLRFRLATATVIHHEIALALTAALLVALTWGATNQVATGTFLVLWVMRLSAKLNIFLGVRNISSEFVPQRLRYLLSYFRRARLNPLMPLSLLLGGVGVAALAVAAVDGTRFVALGCTLVGTLLVLALIEHLFLALPVPDAVLWRWAIRDGLPTLGTKSAAARRGWSDGKNGVSPGRRRG